MKRRKEAKDEGGDHHDEKPAPSAKKLKAGNSELSLRNGVQSNGRTESPSSPKTLRRGLAAEDKNGSSHYTKGRGESAVEGSSEDEVGMGYLEVDAALSVITPKKEKLNGILNDAAYKVNGNTPTKRLNGKPLFSTPVKINGHLGNDETPRIIRNADRSAHRKSTRALIERSVLGNISDNEEEEEGVAQHIYNSEEEDRIDQDALDISALVEAPATPSKRKRGRPRKEVKANLRPPTPPLEDLLPQEKYFFQTRGGRVKTSDNNLSSLALLDHEEYFTLKRAFNDPHATDVANLQNLHAQSYNQWQFELGQDFNICVYGFGSKRALLMRFADYIHNCHASTAPKIVVINGYVPNLTIKDVLTTITSAISGPGHKIGSQPAEMLESVIALLEENPEQNVTVIVHSIDKAPLRRTVAQVILSQLAAHPQIHLVASADHPSFPLLWDSSLRSSYNFLFHDCTTFSPYSTEVDVVDDVHELLGRSGRRVGGKEGVSFVLKSLPENAKNLFRVLIGEQLATMDENHGLGFGDDVDNDDEDNEKRVGSSRQTEIGVEYRVLYQKAVEEFICSNEMNFRTLLKEFHDHQMIQSRKDALGTEILSVPFRKEELETILEDIMS
ncbi:hypothetical protein HYFRA_00000764 [Hymenoscyphus fraxineus]|uniref:Origin recognition complex subunit 2 n=1 Tax=Hymenoscyphus fraxineus TaxID=746836 RepID=A0A9N9PR14_9HELO|nr:hypothetical protein HYFRA_00000764 [Hymenoscyphus fraxineus]